MGFKYKGQKMYFKKTTALNNRRKGETTRIKKINGQKLYCNKKYR